jgi:hypothetical protein
MLYYKVKVIFIVYIYYVLFTRGTHESELNPVGNFRNIPAVVIYQILNIFRVDIQLYQHEWNWENEKLYFIQFRVVPTSTSVDII